MAKNVSYYLAKNVSYCLAKMLVIIELGMGVKILIGHVFVYT